MSIFISGGCAKTVEPIKIPFIVVPWNHVQADHQRACISQLGVLI